MKDLRERAIRGGLAKVCAQAANWVIRIGSLMVLARLLDPRDFGLVAMVTAFTGVLGLFRDFGLSSATVQRLDVSEEQISTLFWINVVIGSILGLTLTAVSPFVAAFYHEPRLLWVSIVLATAFIFNAIGVQHSALLQRQMRFTTLAMIDTLCLIVSTFIGISMAMVGFRYWALVASAVSLPLFTTVCLWFVTGWVPGRPRSKVGVHSMMRFGGGVTLISLVVYIAYNLDKVLLGRFWGANAVGIYGRAYQLINLPTENLNSAVGGVALSALSRLQDDPERLKRYFVKGYCLVLALTIPITISCSLFANDMILVVLGPKWKDSIDIFRLLAPTILVLALINPLWWLTCSLGMVGRNLKLVSVQAPLLIGSYLAGLRYGPKGVALGYSAMMILWVVPCIAWSVHGTVVSFWEIMVAASRPLLSGIAAAALAFGGQSLYGQSLTPLARLMLGVGVLLASYVGMLFYVMGQKPLYLNLLQGLRETFTCGRFLGFGLGNSPGSGNCKTPASKTRNHGLPTTLNRPPFEKLSPAGDHFDADISHGNSDTVRRQWAGHMKPQSLPLVSIVTPLYNEKQYLHECVESVLAQTYPNWEYIIVDNCSTDGSAEIARSYAEKDPRIRVYENSTFLRALPNHNSALRRISPQSKYCKIVFADDWIFPECLERMVALAEEHPSIGIVGAYVLEGQKVICTGLPFEAKLVNGREICRQHLLDKLYVFGSANAVLYRADLVRNNHPFFNEANIHGDTEACFSLLKSSDFGFVHQILTFTRVRLESLSAISSDLQTSLAGTLQLLVAHGQDYLTRDELEDLFRCHISRYYRFLGKSLLLGHHKTLAYHKKKLIDAGMGFSWTRLVIGMLATLWDRAMNPKSTIEKLLQTNDSANLPVRRQGHASKPAARSLQGEI